MGGSQAVPDGGRAYSGFALIAAALAVALLLVPHRLGLRPDPEAIPGTALLAVLLLVAAVWVLVLAVCETRRALLVDPPYLLGGLGFLLLAATPLGGRWQHAGPLAVLGLGVLLSPLVRRQHPTWRPAYVLLAAIGAAGPTLAWTPFPWLAPVVATTTLGCAWAWWRGSRAWPACALAAAGACAGGVALMSAGAEPAGWVVAVLGIAVPASAWAEHGLGPTFRARLLVALALGSALPLLTLIGVGNIVAARHFYDEEREELRGATQRLVVNMERSLALAVAPARILVTDRDLVGDDGEATARALTRALERGAPWVALGLFDGRGQRIAATSERVRLDAASAPWFQGARAGELAFDVTTPTATGQPGIIAGLPVPGSDRVLGIVLDARLLHDILSTAPPGHERYYVGLLDADGHALLQVTYGDLPQMSRRTDSPLARAVRGATGPGELRYEAGGEAWLVAFAPMERAGLAAFAEVPLGDVFASAYRYGELALIFLSLALPLAVVLGGLAAGALSRPVAGLAAAARALAAGDSSHPLPRTTATELQLLVTSFAEMRAALGERTRSLAERTEELARDRERLIATSAALGEELRQITLLYELSSDLLSEPDRDAVAQRVAAAARSAMRAEGASLWLTDQEGEPPTLAAHAGAARADVARAAGWLSAEGPDFPAGGPAALSLVAQGRAVGVLLVARSQPFGESERQVLGLLAQQAALALSALESTRQAARAAALEELTRQQRLMINVIAHELRTPLSYILGYSELLLHRGSTPELLSEGVSTIHRGALQLRDLVSDIVELSQLETGQLVLDCEPVDLARLLPSWVAELASPPRVAVAAPPSLPRAWADAARLRHVVNHLVRNALKFSPPDATVTVWAEATDAEHVAISVLDRGPGLAPEERERILEPFYRTARAHDDAAPGSGLGLPLVKRLVELHGGRISVESALGEGSTFTVVLPTVGAVPVTNRPAEAGAADDNAGQG